MSLPCVAPLRACCAGARPCIEIKLRDDHRHSRFHTSSVGSRFHHPPLQRNIKPPRVKPTAGGSAMRSIRLAIVGLGKIARDQHVPAIARTNGVELAAVASRNASLDNVAHFPTLDTLLREAPNID